MRLRTICIGLFILILLSTFGIVASGFQDQIKVSDVAIVLGSKVETTGQPSARLAARLDKAVQLYAQSKFKQIIVSGGTGVEGFDEAKVMRDYLISKQIPEQAIWLDSAGVNTQATAINSVRMMRAHGWQSAIVISQYFHLPRSRLLLHAAGLRQVNWAHANIFELRDIYSSLREFFALLHALLIDG